MDAVIESMTGPQLIGFTATVLGIVGAVLAVLAGIVVPVWMWTRRTEARADLARDLAAAGMTADQIERVVGAVAGGPTAPPVSGR